MNLCFDSSSLRRDRISDTSEACNVGVKRRGSKTEMFSSFAESLEFRLLLSGRGGGEDEDGGGDDVPLREDNRDTEVGGV